METGKSASAAVGPVAGFNASQSQADTLEANLDPWLDLEASPGNALQVRPGLTFTGKSAAEPV